MKNTKTCWDIFAETGSIDAYLIHRACENGRKEKNARHKGKRDSFKTDGIW